MSIGMFSYTLTFQGWAGFFQHGFKCSATKFRNFLHFQRGIRLPRVNADALFTHFDRPKMGKKWSIR